MESIKQELFGPGIARDNLHIQNGHVGIQQMNESRGEILERLEGRVRNLIYATFQELESAGKPCSQTEADVSAMSRGGRED